MNNKKICGLIISAGLSGRMKRFKPIAIYKGDTFISNIISKLETACDEIIIVAGHQAAELKSEVMKAISGNSDKLKFIQNDDYRKGMFTSLQKGIEVVKKCDWVIYHFVDQPGLPVHFYKEFLSQIDENYNWIQPAINERKGHPLLLGKDLFETIISESADSNLRELSNNKIFRKKYWECRYPEIFQDIDTEEEYLNLG